MARMNGVTLGSYAEPALLGARAAARDAEPEREREREKEEEASPQLDLSQWEEAVA